MREKTTRRVNRLTTFFSSFIIFPESMFIDFLKTKYFSARIKLDSIKKTKKIISHNISIFTRDNYDN